MLSEQPCAAGNGPLQRISPRDLKVGKNLVPLFWITPVKSTHTAQPHPGIRLCTETQSIKCAASQHEKRKKESERRSPGSLTYPVHTRLILASNGPKIPKGRGECSMPGKGIEG